MVPSAVSGELDGHRALVTGSSRNLGAEIARSLATRGCRVAVTYHKSRVEADELVADLAGGGHVAVRADLSTPTGVAPMIEAAVRGLGGNVDVLVNNHGPFSMTRFVDLSQAEYTSVMDGNLTAAYLAVQQVAPGMRAAGWGRVVNLSAGSAYIRNHSVYGLAKQATEILTESLALELGPQITVNAVAPGQIAESASEVESIDPSFVRRALRRTPAGRLATRHEIAEIVATLCTRPFDLVTGAVIPVDGGWRLNRF